MLAEVMGTTQSQPPAVWRAELSEEDACRDGSAGTAGECQAHDELNRLGDVQRLLLPEAPPQVVGLDLAVSYRPAGRAGGDYYDFLPVPDGRWGILIADVTGHGAPAALGMAVLHATARASGGRSSPAELMGYVNRQLADGYSSRRGNFANAFYAVFDPQTRTLTYTSAGHPPPRLRRGESVSALGHAQSLPLGIEADETFGERTIHLRSGDHLLLYTDGVTERRNAEGEMFGEARLDQALALSAASAAETAGQVSSALRNFSIARAGRDDSTIVVAAIG